MLSIATHEAAQMLKAGWTIEYCQGVDQIAWRDPKGISGSDYLSNDLYPSAHAVLRAFEMGHIHVSDRVIDAELDSIAASDAKTEFFRIRTDNKHHTEIENRIEEDGTIVHRIIGPTSQGLKRYPENEGRYVANDPNGPFCTCLETCPVSCKGLCGCEACSQSYSDSLD